MKQVILGLACIALSVSAFAQSNRHGLGTDPNGRYEINTTTPPDALGSREVEMRNRNNPDPSQRYRGQIEQDGSVQLRNQQGERLRGTIEQDGSGRLRDQEGNTYRVRPR